MKEQKQSDREIILMNLVSQLAYELFSAKLSRRCEGYFNDPDNAHRVRTEGGFDRASNFKVGDLVMCMTSVWRQENPWLVSYVHQVGYPGDPSGLVLRAIGTNLLCNYGNESFCKIVNVPEKLLWEGQQRRFADKLHKALRTMDTYIHRFRFVTFPASGKAEICFGEAFGGIGKKTMPYTLTVDFTPKITLKEIKKQLIDQGFGTRKFEEVKQGESNWPNPQAITRDTLVSTLSKEGIGLK